MRSIRIFDLFNDARSLRRGRLSPTMFHGTEIVSVLVQSSLILENSGVSEARHFVGRNLNRKETRLVVPPRAYAYRTSSEGAYVTLFQSANTRQVVEVSSGWVKMLN